MIFIRSSIRLHSCQGILLSPQKAQLCNPCPRNELSPISQEGQVSFCKSSFFSDNVHRSLATGFILRWRRAHGIRVAVGALLTRSDTRSFRANGSGVLCRSPPLP